MKHLADIKFQVSGVVKQPARVDGDVDWWCGNHYGLRQSEIGWGVLGAASLNLADIATLTDDRLSLTATALARYVINGGFQAPATWSRARQANPNISDD